MTNEAGPCRISTSAVVHRYFQTFGNKLKILGARKDTLCKFLTRTLEFKASYYVI